MQTKQTKKLQPTYEDFLKIRLTSERVSHYVPELCTLLQRAKDLDNARGNFRLVVAACLAVSLLLLSFVGIYTGVADVGGMLKTLGPSSLLVIIALGLCAGYAAGSLRYRSRIAEAEREIEHLCLAARSSKPRYNDFCDALECVEILNYRLACSMPERMRP